MPGTMLRLASAALVASVLLCYPSALAQQSKAPGSSPEAVLAYRDAANFQNNSAFDLAAEEWQKFLKNHPNDPLVPKAQHYLGVCQLQLKQHAAAAATFETVIRRYPNFELLDDAYFNLATSQYALAVAGQKDLYAKAAQNYAALLQRSPRSKHREEALFYSGEALYAQGKKAEAVKAYERLLTEFRNTKRRADVLYALGVAQEELGNHESAGRTYDALLRDFPQHSLTSEVRLRKAETLLQAGEVAAAERLFAAAVATKDFDAVDHALSRQAYCLAKLEKFAEAAGLYARLATEYPQSPYAADAVISAGRLYYRANDSGKARQWLERALERRGQHATEAAHWLARLLIRAGDAPAAAELAQRELGQAEGPYAAHLQLDLADALYEIPAQREQALTRYIEFASRNSRHELAPQAVYSAAFTALELRRYDEALRHARSFLNAFPDSDLAPDVQYVAAESQLQLENYTAAAKAYRELIERHSNRPDVQNWKLRRAHAALLAKNYDEVIATLTSEISRLKSDEAQAEARFLIGSAHFQAGRFDQAIKQLSESVESGKSRHADEALLLLARAQAKTGRNQDAQTQLSRLLREFPDSRVADEAHYRLGELFDGEGDYAAAVKEYDIVSRKFPRSRFFPYAIYGRGWAQFKLKDVAAAADSFATILNKYADHELADKALLGRAMCRRQTGDFRGALADLDAFLKSNPDASSHSEALYEHGLTLVALQDYTAAVRTFESLLKSNPEYANTDRVLYEIGWALKSQEKHQEAASRFQRLVREFPDSPLGSEAWFHVAEDHYDRKQYPEAEKAYAAARRNASGELAEKAAYKLAWTRFQLQDYAGALERFTQQLKDFPQGELAADAVFMKAECLFRQEKYADAWPAYEAALRTTPSTPTVEALSLLHAAQTAAQLKNWPESEKLLTKLLERQPSSPVAPEAHYELGWVKQNQGQTDAALAAYEEAASQSRDHVGARARFMRGELLFEQKKHDQASREFQRAMYGYGGEDASPETKNWQAKSGYEAGRCAEVQLNLARDAATRQKQLTDARRFYTFVAEKHAGHELATEAKKRLSALTKIEAPASKQR